MKNLLFISLFFLVACSTDNSTETSSEANESVVEQENIQTVQEESIVENTDSVAVENEEPKAEDYTETAKKVGENVVEGTKVKEVKMETVTFCDCVKKQNDIDQRMEDAEEDAEINALMEEMDKLSEGPCKDMLSETQTTPEQREERKLRIAKCLE